MADKEGKTQSPFISLFSFKDDESKKGRILSSVKIGGVHVSRLTIEPKVITGNVYHTDTRVMFYVESGRIQAAFEHIETKKKRVCYFEKGTEAVHIPTHIAHATKNIGTEKAVVVFFSNKPLRSKDNIAYRVL